jgi:hypothetical protein
MSYLGAAKQPIDFTEIRPGWEEQSTGRRI